MISFTKFYVKENGMKALLKVFMGVALFFGLSQAAMFQGVPEDKAEIVQNGEDKMYCPNCGMYLPKFYKTNHAAQLPDGEVRQYCSIYCLAEQLEITDLKGQKDKLKKIMVVDVPSLKFIDAKKAYYVIGSSKKGTMTMTSKYAFADKAEAEKFAKENGGTVGSFEDAYNEAIKDFARDTAFVYKNRSSKMYDMGKKIYEAKCNKKKLESFDAHTMGMMKEMIKKSGACGENLNDKQLQALMLYYWDVRLENFEKLYGKNEAVQNEMKKMGLATQSGQSITVPKDAKCPVCGMFVAKYPKWVAMITTKDGHKHYFDGVKDMMKYYFNPKKYGAEHGKSDFASIAVSDYYTLNELNAAKAYYVVGSNVYGPMGNELIPFDTMEAAEEFSKAHNGKKVLTFEQITKGIVYNLDQ